MVDGRHTWSPKRLDIVHSILCPVLPIFIQLATLIFSHLDLYNTSDHRFYLNARRRRTSIFAG